MMRGPGLRKALLGGLLAAVLVVVLEGVTFVGLAVRDGGLPSPTRWRAERERVAQESGGAAAATDAAARGIEAGGMQVLHPYLGFVLNPAFKVDWRDVDAQGFMRRPGEVDPPPGTPRFVLGLFGGSVAGGLCMRGREDILGNGVDEEGGAADGGHGELPRREDTAPAAREPCGAYGPGLSRSCWISRP